MAKNYFPNLDGLRFFAAMAVFCAHFWNFYPVPVGFILRGFVANPGLGVNFFFVLSGFLICRLILREENFRLGNFYMRRVLRIWPVYFAVVLASLLATRSPLPQFQIHNCDYRMVACFLANFDMLTPGHYGYITSVLWSVSVEEQFYLFFPLLVVFARGWLTPVLIGLLGMSLWCRSTMAPPSLYYHSAAVMSNLMLGCLAAQACSERKGLRTFFARLPPVYSLLGYALLILLVIARPWLLDDGRPIDAMVTGLMFVFVILDQNYAKHPMKLEKLPPLGWLGRRTYGMYCYHIGIVIVVSYYAHQYVRDGFGYCLAFLTALGLTIGVSALSFELLEKPFLRLKERFSPKAKGPVETGPSAT